MCPATWGRPLSQGGGPPTHPGAQWARGSGSLVEGRVLAHEVGDLGLGLSIGNVRQEDIPSAVHHGKGSYQRNLSLKKP